MGPPVQTRKTVIGVPLALAGVATAALAMVARKLFKSRTPVDHSNSQREVAQLLDALRRVGYPSDAAESWWLLDVHPELNGRTAERAWQEGDRQAVKRAVEVLASRRLAKALSASPGAVDQLLKSA
jgi:hypothetical protein